MRAMVHLIEQAYVSSSTILFFISLITLALLLQVFTKKFRNKLNLPPSPPKLPLIGNLHQLGPLAHQSFQDLSKKYGPIMLLHLGEIPTLVVSSAHMAREVLKTHDSVFASRPQFKVATILSYNHHDIAFAPYNEQWRSLRKITSMHLFSSKRVVQTFKTLREEEVLFMLNKVKVEAASSPKGIVNMRKTFYKLTNDIICHMITGESFRRNGREEKLMNMVFDSVPLLGKFNPEDNFPSLKWMGPIIGAKVRNEAQKIFLIGYAMMTEILSDRVQGRTDGDQDFLDILLKLQKDEKQKKEFQINDLHIKALCYQSLTAGSEPLAISLEWTMVELLRHPRVLKKLEEEVRQIPSQNDDEFLKSEDVSKLTYLKATIAESFRLHPPTPLLVPRESMDNCNIEGYDIPKGSRIFVNTYAMGRDPEVWDNPLEYRPERFVDNPFNYNGNVNYEIVPFGGGRRICPGMQLSLLTMELALANLLRIFDWELPTGIKPEDVDMTETPSLSLKRKKDLELVAKPRQIIT